MRNTIEQLVDGLAGRELIGDVLDLADEHLRRGDADFVAELGTAVHARFRARDKGSEHHSLFALLLWRLATTHRRDAIAHALRLGFADLSPTERPDRRAAAVLAAHQSPRDLAQVFVPGEAAYGNAPDELRACLVHELVLRGATPPSEAAAWAADSPFWQAHPLARLPWSLSPLEGTPRLPRYWLGGGGSGIAYGLPEGHELPNGPAPVPAVRANDLDFALTTAVDRWSGRYNGRVEAQVHVTDAPVDPDALHPMLASLPLDCLDGLTGARNLAVVATTPAEAWRQLFAAASSGGGHQNEWWYGAHGRLAAWRSLAALAGAPGDATPAEVERRVAACSWYGFRAWTDWFNCDLWDLGLAALSPDRTRLAVLAATDYNGG
ncbi:DUF6183 family protein [Streptomyces sp. SP17BM10]|uniref:DUF6183 family protein n=1 Tax=Streptomyces sp. SP17BM10 TaxID=3002530 RepID=UPI002E75FB09|nr:DUF6183 family protein [Streptomyces sp. SP17BM10]MEE1786189.1 DUF6183 family protein [Streptomyces sp. SP17BM10]